MPGTGNYMGARLRELCQQRVAVSISNVRRVTATNEEGRMRPGGDGLPAHDVIILVPQHRDVKTPLPLNKRLQQELHHAFFIKMLTHHGCCLLTGGNAGLRHRINCREDLIVTANVVIHWGDINHHQPGNSLRCQCCERHDRFTTHRMPDEGHFLQVVGVERIQEILRHCRVGHLVCAPGKSVVAHIDL